MSEQIVDRLYELELTKGDGTHIHLIGSKESLHTDRADADPAVYCEIGHITCLDEPYDYDDMRFSRWYYSEGTTWNQLDASGMAQLFETT